MSLLFSSHCCSVNDTSISQNRKSFIQRTLDGLIVGMEVALRSEPLENKFTCSSELPRPFYLPRNNNFSFGIFRKETHTESIIHFDSAHHYSTKLSALSSRAHRLTNVPISPEEYLAQRNTILMIAANNGFPTNTEINIINKFQKKKLNKLLFSLGSTSNEPCNKFCKTPYLGNVSVKVGKIWHPSGILL